MDSTSKKSTSHSIVICPVFLFLGQLTSLGNVEPSTRADRDAVVNAGIWPKQITNLVLVTSPLSAQLAMCVIAQKTSFDPASALGRAKSATAKCLQAANNCQQESYEM